MSAEDPAKEEMQPEHYDDFLDCARYGEVEGVGIYIEHGADVNWADEFGSTALHRGGSPAAIAMLPPACVQQALHCPAQRVQMDTLKL